MPDRLDEVERQLAELGGAVRALEARLAALEAAPGRARPRAAAAARGGTDAAGRGAPLATDVAALSRSLQLGGRTLLVLAGGFVLRALTDAGTLPGALGVALGLVYAGLWIALADRAGRAGAAWSAGFHAASAALLGFPLLVEATVRFRLLSPGAAAALLTALVAVALGVAARRRLQSLAWLFAAGGTLTAFGLAFATGRAAAPTAFLVLLGVATLWLGYVLDWHGPRWPVAVVADLLVLVVSLGAVAPGAADGPRAAYLLQGGLLLLYLGSFAARTLLLGRAVVPFELVQSALAIAVGLGGAGFVAARTAHGAAAGFGAVAVAAGLAAYGVAFAFVERRQHRPENFAFYTSAGGVLLLSGTALLLPAPALAWAALAVIAAVAARRAGSRILAAHAALYGVAAALGSGLLGHALSTGLAQAEEPWSVAGPGALVALAALAAVAWLGAGAPRPGWPDRVPRVVVIAALALGAAGVVTGWLVPPLAGAPDGSLGPAAVAAVRTAVWVAGILALAWLGTRPAWIEAGWLAWPAVALGGLKLLGEDLRRGRPATLVLAFALYGAALIVVARVRPGRARAQAAAPR